MNKLVIPTILAFSVLIGGIFAFMPVEKATTVHLEIIAAIQGFMTNSQDAILLDLEEKIKLSSASDGPTITSGNNNLVAVITIRALDGGQPTTFNLKECYLTGTTDNLFDDEIEVKAITVDSRQVFTGVNRGFSAYGPVTASTGLFNLASVEIISGLGFHTGLGADDTITMDVEVDEGDRINEIKCIAFVQQSADLLVTIDDEGLIGD